MKKFSLMMRDFPLIKGEFSLITRQSSQPLQDRVLTHYETEFSLAGSFTHYVTRVLTHYVTRVFTHYVTELFARYVTEFLLASLQSFCSLRYRVFSLSKRGSSHELRARAPRCSHSLTTERKWR